MSEQHLHQQVRFNHRHDVTYPIPQSLGSGYFRSVCPREGMLLVLEQYRLNEDMKFISDSAPRCLGFSYCMSGRVRWSINGLPQQFTTRKGQCEILSSVSTGGSGCYEPGAPLVLVNIMLCPDLLQSFLDAGGEDSPGAGILQPPDSEGTIRYHQRSMTGPEQRALEQLLISPCRSMADSLFIQAKIMELVSFHLKEMDATDGKAMNRPVDSDSQKMINIAKGILRSSMQSPPTIPHLARMIGTNETRLKKIFRTNLGTTVFGYLTSCRMQRACDLLKESGLTMSEIGAELGYSERTHFTRAFTRLFGMPPSQYRRDRKGQPQKLGN